MGMEALPHIDMDDAFAAPVKVSHCLKRDMTQVCRYLRDYPGSLRMTGPNPAAGPEWIVDSGCPEDIVQPERWISLNIDPVWFERSPWEDGQLDFPHLRPGQGRVTPRVNRATSGACPSR